MIAFPNLPNPGYPLTQNPEDNTVKSKFEDGSVQVRRKFTKSRRTFTLTWSKLPNDKFEILDNWVVNVAHFGCEKFVWTHPQSGKKYTCYVSSYQSPKLSELNYWDVTLEITEV